MKKATVKKMVEKTGHQLDETTMTEKIENPGCRWAIRIPNYAMANYFPTLQDVYDYCAIAKNGQNE